MTALVTGLIHSKSKHNLTVNGVEWRLNPRAKMCYSKLMAYGMVITALPGELIIYST